MEPGLTAALISLAVGIATSAISYFLAPKPKSAETVKQTRLGDRTGASRFAQTFGFDSQAELADYGQPIPIIFTRYTGPTGGILAAPDLVWSRAASYGRQQGLKQLLIVGEAGLGAGIPAPELNGIFIGTSPIDAALSHTFAFYWNRDGGRIVGSNLLYGTRGGVATGDPQQTNDVYLCPTRSAQEDTGFSSAFSISNGNEFGVYAPIHNGTDYRINFRLVAIPALDDATDDPGNNLLMERVKVSGDYGYVLDVLGINTYRTSVKNEAQRGTGRGYSRRMGIISVNGQTPSTAKQEYFVEVGDRCQFYISDGNLPEDRYFIGNSKNTKVDDINNELESQRTKADDALQIGETFMIGKTVWKVVSRATETWIEGATQTVTLECVEIFGDGSQSKIGAINKLSMLDRGVLTDDDGVTPFRGFIGTHAGISFYPLLKVQMGMVRNTRACEVTEIGIRSQVWNRANGLCNFSSLPSPAEFRAAERNTVAIQNGNMNLFFKRSTLFSILVRPAGTDASGNPYRWDNIGEQFCISGSQPVDQYNFIRITHPERRQYEFRFVPTSGAQAVQVIAPTEQIWRLNASSGSVLSRSIPSPYGTFKIESRGKVVTLADVTFNPEMMQSAVISGGSSSGSIPNSLSVRVYLPDVETSTAQVTAVRFTDYLPAGNYEGRKGAFYYEYLGTVSSAGVVKSFQVTALANPNSPSTSPTVTLRITAISTLATNTTSGQLYNWSFSSVAVVSSSGNWNTSQTFGVTKTLSGSNPWLYTGLTYAGIEFKVTQTTESSLLTGQRRQTALYELFGLPGAIGTTKTVYKTITLASKAIKIKFDSVVKAPPDSSLGVTAVWDFPTIVCDPSGTTGSWQLEEAVEWRVPVTVTTRWALAGSDTGFVLRVTSLNSTTATPTLTAERQFEKTSQLADVSHYNEIDKSNSSSPEHEIVYVNEIVSNELVPQYDRLTTAGLAIKASRDYTNVNQLRFWLANGISVQRFHPDEPGVGPSNLFVDLVYYLLTDRTAGVGAFFSTDLIKSEDFSATAQFLKTNKLFFDGAISDSVNVRQFIADTAPFMLCNFVISDGKFSIVPALQTTAAGEISTAPIQIKQLFTAGNIIEDSFTLDFLGAEERKDFQAVMRYRQERKNQLPEDRTLVVRYQEPGSAAYPVESFDMTQFCTSRDHALLAAMYFLAIRRHVTHTVTFRTTPFGLDLAPGDYIKVVTEASPYQAANNGAIDASGNITSASELEDGTYQILLYRAGGDDVTDGVLTVAAGKAVEPDLWNSIFTLNDATVSVNTYMVEQLTLGEDGLVEIVGMHAPSTSTLNSQVALDLTTPELFYTEG